MKDYHDLCLKYVLFLANVFEKIRNKYLESYGLYPCHYLSPLGLSWGVMLSITKVKLHLISDVNMYLFLEKCMRVFLLFLKVTAKQTISI